MAGLWPFSSVLLVILAFYDPDVRKDTPPVQNTRLQRLGAKLAYVTFAAMTLTQVALPLQQGEATALVTATVLLLFTTSVLIAITSWKPERILGAGVAIGVFALLTEVVGSRTGFPFGAYDYTDALNPQLFGVPAIVPLAWVGMSFASFEVARRITRNPWLQVFLGAWLLMAWDLFLDPMMVDLGYWQWGDSTGGWYGIPWSNFAGWFATGLVMCSICKFVLSAAPANNGLAGLYLWMTGFSALGFILPFAFDVPMLGFVGALASVPFGVFAFRRKDRPWLTQ